MSTADNIKKLREIFGVTQEELSKIAGVTENAVSKWETGRAEPRMGAVEKIAACYGLKKTHIIEDNGMDFVDPLTKKTTIPIPGAIIPIRSKIAYAPLRGRIHAGKAQEPEILEDEVELPSSILDRHPKSFFLEVEGDCMDKVYTECSAVLIDPDREPQDGSIAAVSIDGSDVVMRRLKRGANTLILSPESNNPEHKDIVITSDSDHVVENVGTVVWFQAKKEME